jgi:hypothetical protein
MMPLERTFKTKWFAKAARKALIDDAELCAAIEQVRAGQADDLGGGVFKKRLDKNRYRSIVLAKGGNYWVYEFLFAKKDMANIDERRLGELGNIASAYSRLTDLQLAQLLAEKDFEEICCGDQA